MKWRDTCHVIYCVINISKICVMVYVTSVGLWLHHWWTWNNCSYLEVIIDCHGWTLHIEQTWQYIGIFVSFLPAKMACWYVSSQEIRIYLSCIVSTMVADDRGWYWPSYPWIFLLQIQKGKNIASSPNYSYDEGMRHGLTLWVQSLIDVILLLLSALCHIVLCNQYLYCFTGEY